MIPAALCAKLEASLQARRDGHITARELHAIIIECGDTARAIERHGPNAARLAADQRADAEAAEILKGLSWA